MQQKVAAGPRFADVNRHVTGRELAEARQAAEDAGLWRLDARWRHAGPTPALRAQW